MSKLATLSTQALNAAKPHLKKFWYYGRVELAPPKLSEIPAIATEFGKLVSAFRKGNWKNATVKIMKQKEDNEDNFELYCYSYDEVPMLRKNVTVMPLMHFGCGWSAWIAEREKKEREGKKREGEVCVRSKH